MGNERTGEPGGPGAGVGRALPLLGELVGVRVAGEATGGRFAIVETRASRGAGPPRHRHSREDEVVYVLEGQIGVYVNGAWRACPAGTGVLLPRGGEHTFVVRSAAARLLVLLLPAGLEGCYRELEPAHGGGGERGVSGRWPGVERLITVAARYGVAITGPVPGTARG